MTLLNVIPNRSEAPVPLSSLWSIPTKAVAARRPGSCASDGDLKLRFPYKRDERVKYGIPLERAHRHILLEVQRIPDKARGTSHN
jgi:hypothetical protein